MTDERGWPVPGSEPDDQEKRQEKAQEKGQPKGSESDLEIGGGGGEGEDEIIVDFPAKERSVGRDKGPPSDTKGKALTASVVVALAAVIIYAAYRLYGRQDEIRNAVILAVAIAVALLFAGMRQYHLYRSALQELIVGRREKAAEAEAKAKAEKEAAKEKSELMKKIEALTVKFDAQSKSENTSLEEFGRTLASHSDRMQSVSQTLAAVERILDEMRKKPPQPSGGPGGDVFP